MPRPDELNGNDLRRDPLEDRKATLEMMLPRLDLASGSTSTWKTSRDRVSARVQARVEGPVYKPKYSACSSARLPDWVKMKNANAPAVRREAGEDEQKEMPCRKMPAAFQKMLRPSEK
jgi:ATP-dependent DNA ligase